MRLRSGHQVSPPVSDGGSGTTDALWGGRAVAGPAASGRIERPNQHRISERVNLTIRQCVSKLTRRTWGPAKDTPELLAHLEWWRSYYHFVRPHESLAVELSRPIPQCGKQQPKKYRRRTPAMVAGLTDKRWTVRELIGYPLL